MKYQLSNIRIPAGSEVDLEQTIRKMLNNQSSYLISWKPLHQALDTRRHNHPIFNYTIELEVSHLLTNLPNLLPLVDDEPIPQPDTKLSHKSPVIIGMGPAGLFCALAMVERGLQPILIDRGSNLVRRTEAVEAFWRQGILNPESNVQFGEGGAGAFSDGKLTSRTRNIYITKVFDSMVELGAPQSIRYQALPHLGTDGIRAMVAKLRTYLEEKGCSFVYNARLDQLKVKAGKVSEITINGESHTPELVVLALGNAARDTYRMLASTSVKLEAKPFAIGFRIMHSQGWINQSIYGGDKWAEKLGAASYRLTANRAGKGAYTFCMCPGGFIIAASSEADALVTNGMSYAARSHSFGNSAIVTVIDEADYGTGLFDGMQLQSDIERKAYSSGYAAPYQSAGDYLADKLTPPRSVDCLFPASIPMLLTDIFPASVNSALRLALKHFDHVLPGFIAEGMLIAPETRTSSPVRILRDKQNLNCLGISNLYAIGEGSGYAGGIISSAADGYRIGSKFAL